MADLAPPLDAPQHERGPRPLPLFLELVRQAGERDRALAARALSGLRAYQQASRTAACRVRPVILNNGPAVLRDCGGTGRPVVLVPSLINPPNVLDLEPGCSLADSLSESGRVLLLDWGKAQARALSVTGHIHELLLPLLQQIGEPALLVGYCLGGTMALAAAAASEVRAVATLASPWDFAAYPKEARDSLQRLWAESRPVAAAFGALPIEILQAAFWSLDPHRMVAKYARLAELDPRSDEARRFVMLEDWANGGEPIPAAAAEELILTMFGDNAPGRGAWAALPDVPMLHFTAGGDRIVPTATAPPGERINVAAGHVGMIVGRAALGQVHQPLNRWIARH